MGVSSWRDKILLYLLAVGAVVEDIAYETAYALPNRGTYSSSGYSFYKSDYFKSQPRLLRDALRDLNRRKLIEANGIRGQRSFRITTDGFDILFKKFPTLKYRRYKWDGVWRLVVYDVNESEKNLRARLRTKLRHIGFIFVQKSVWISPFPVEKDLEEFFKANGLWGRILLFKATLPKEESLKLLKSFDLVSLDGSGSDAAAFIRPIKEFFRVKV